MYNDFFGAAIERGQVVEKTQAGYRVKSLTRVGVVTPQIQAMQDAEFAVGDGVYFFLFDDGEGGILGKAAGGIQEE